MTPSDGLTRIATAFAEARRERHAALMPYLTLGYPDRQTALELVRAVARHSDLLELGVPFSDPIADGPTIQRSTQRALEAGMTVRDCLALVRELRETGTQTPALLMGYYNPILAYGIEAFVRDAAAAGVDGLIVPDLPPEESADLERAAAAAGLAFIFFLAPTSDARRVADVLPRANGFLYMVSVTGVTGARATMRDGLEQFVGAVREQTAVPVAVGFGISSADHARKVGGIADGVIVGSALIDAFDQGGIGEAVQFVMTLRDALGGETEGRDRDRDGDREERQRQV
jgi:tryptophan synthase alpha chain